eukprot:20481-Heterococcus_DN1.PRE.2
MHALASASVWSINEATACDFTVLAAWCTFKLGSLVLVKNSLRQLHRHYMLAHSGGNALEQKLIRMTHLILDAQSVELALALCVKPDELCLALLAKISLIKPSSTATSLQQTDCMHQILTRTTMCQDLRHLITLTKDSRQSLASSYQMPVKSVITDNAEYETPF